MKRDPLIVVLIVLILLLLFTRQAFAIPVDTWSGAGPYACNGNCSQDWAVSKLTASEQIELQAIQQKYPTPQYVEVNNGDVFTFVSYFKNNEPKAYRTTTIVTIEKPTGSYGWVMDGWAFVKLDACSNWTIINTKHQVPNPLVLNSTPINNYPVSYWGTPNYRIDPLYPVYYPPYYPEIQIEPPTIPVIPSVSLSGSLIFLGLALSLLIFTSKRKKS